MINNLDKLSQKEIQELFNRLSVHIQDIKIPLDTDIQSNKNYFSNLKNKLKIIENPEGLNIVPVKFWCRRSGLSTIDMRPLSLGGAWHAMCHLPGG